MSARKITVLGAGGWGTALAHVAAERGHRVRLWCREPSVRESIRKRRENELFLPGVPLSPEIAVASEFSEVLPDAEIVLIVIPSAFVGMTLAQAAPFLGERAYLVSASKGIETGSLRRMSEVIRDVMGASRPIIALSGPSFAREVALGKPTAVVAASADSTAVRFVQEQLSTRVFQIQTSGDLVGVELGGAFKNVIAVAAGMAQGAGLGPNAIAALLTRGIAEISALAVSMGGAASTLSGLAGLGDMVLTCTGDLSRNRAVGIRLGKGESLRQIVDSMQMVAEGIETSRAANRLAERYSVDFHIARAVERVLDEKVSAEEAIRELFSS